MIKDSGCRLSVSTAYLVNIGTSTSNHPFSPLLCGSQGEMGDFNSEAMDEGRRIMDLGLGDPDDHTLPIFQHPVNVALERRLQNQ